MGLGTRPVQTQLLSLLHLPLLRFYIVGGCWDRTRTAAILALPASRLSDHSARSHPLVVGRSLRGKFPKLFKYSCSQVMKLRKYKKYTEFRGQPRCTSLRDYIAHTVEYNFFCPFVINSYLRHPVST